MNGERQIFDFSSPKTSGEWQIINDSVMGGVSQSKIEFIGDNFLTFSGKVLPDNNGGFASVRALLHETEIEGYEGVIIKARGDGKFYNLRFRTNKNFDGISYQANFKTSSEDWKEYKLPFSEFVPVFRGMTIANQPKLESKNIIQVGFLIADKQFGEFELDIEWIKFY